MRKPRGRTPRRCRTAARRGRRNEYRVQEKPQPARKEPAPGHNWSLSSPVNLLTASFWPTLTSGRNKAAGWEAMTVWSISRDIPLVLFRDPPEYALHNPPVVTDYPAQIRHLFARSTSSDRGSGRRRHSAVSAHTGTAFVYAGWLGESPSSRVAVAED